MSNTSHSIITGTEKEQGKGKNTNLEREARGCMVVVWFSLVYLFFDVGRQVTSYGVKYYNNHSYPVPQTQIVAIIETVKLVISLVQVVLEGHAHLIRVTWMCAIPAVIFAVNNNIFYLALRYTTPPIWSIMISARMVSILLVYKIFFKRPVSFLQWTGTAIILGAVTMTNLSVGPEGGHVDTGTVTSDIFYLGICWVVVVGGSTVSSVTMEYIFKNTALPFNVIQIQVYFFSSVATWMLYALEYHGTPVSEVTGHQFLIFTLLLANILFSCASGITTAVITKKLDTIVKLYFNALSNVATALVCAIIFSDAFEFSANFAVCLILMLLGVFALESKTVAQTQLFSKLSQHIQKNKME